MKKYQPKLTAEQFRKGYSNAFRPQCDGVPMVQIEIERKLEMRADVVHPRRGLKRE